MKCIEAKLPDGANLEEIEEAVAKSQLDDLTEYGRVVHAEMDAIISCCRKYTDCRKATLYCTTFPCHNCAKHIVAAGIERVVYVEPYPKSKALDLHSDSISFGPDNLKSSPRKVLFEPFMGVGPRNFVNLFSLKLGIGSPIRRKNKKTGEVATEEWARNLRIQMVPYSYLQREAFAAKEFNEIKMEVQSNGGTK